MWTYAPDLDERTPNIILAGSSNVVPTARGGFRPAYFADVGGSNQPSYPALAAACVGARYLLRNDGTDRLFAGTATKIYEANQVAAYAWTDESRAGDYSGVTQWMFDQYGPTSLAAASRGTHTEIQFSTGVVGTSFANLTNAPKARIIVTQDNALYAFDYDPAGTAFPDGWIRSDTGNITNWTTGSGECVSGTFTETPGDITAAIKQGSGVVVFKDRGMWRGQYVGLPEVVRWELITPSVGCLGPLAVVNIDDVLYFADSNGFWIYDGSRPQKVTNGLEQEYRRSVATGVSTQDTRRCFIAVDDVYGVLYFFPFFVTGGSASSFYSFNYVTGAWGPICTYFAGSTNSPFAISTPCPGTYNKLSVMPGINGGSVAPNNYVFDAFGKKLWNMSESTITDTAGTASHGCSIIPSLFGGNVHGSAISRIYPDLSAHTLVGSAGATTTATVTAYRRPFSGGYQQGNATGTYSDALGYADVRASGNWYKLTLTSLVTGAAGNGTTVTQSFEWLGFEPEYAGSRPKN